MAYQALGRGEEQKKSKQPKHIKNKKYGRHQNIIKSMPGLQEIAQTLHNFHREYALQATAPLGDSPPPPPCVYLFLVTQLIKDN